jgi:hypothetical protein
MGIKRQTAVTWLEKEIANGFISGKTMDFFTIAEYLKKAKDIEQKQIVNAYYDGQSLMKSYASDELEDAEEANEYYKYTYEV